MNKLKKVKIENFRNLKSIEFDIADTTVISGPNGVGKSNCINAMVWFFTDTIYTDNPGVGENDVNSIVPTYQIKGERTSVEIEFTNGTVLRKEYVTGYDKTTGKPNKHTTKGYVNGVESKNMDEWKQTLLKIVDFAPAFPNVKEMNLYIDPVYALQKLDSKDLRQFLVDLGCSVTNEEMYELGFEDLRKYDSKYLGNFINMRIDLKKQLKSVKDAIDKDEVLIQHYNDVEEFDNEKLEEVNKQLDDLNDKKAKINTGGSYEAWKQKEEELKQLKKEKEFLLQKKIDEWHFKINDVEAKYDLQYENNKALIAQNSLKLKSLIENDKISITSVETQQRAKISEKTALQAQLETLKVAYSTCKKSKIDAKNQLINNESKEYSGYVTCPDCAKTFAPDNDDLIKFESSKAKTKEYYTNLIAKYNLDMEDHMKQLEEIKTKAAKINQDLEAYNVKLEELNKQLQEHQREYDEYDDEPEETEAMLKLKELKNEYIHEVAPLEARKIENDPEIIDMQAEVDELKSRSYYDSEAVLEPILSKIQVLEETREDLYIKRSKWNTKLEVIKDLEKVRSQMNDQEHLLARVEEFIHKMIELINSKAKELTGIDFVMIEENLGNDGVKEVCYAKVNGVPFATINTAEKYKVGIKFIEKIKEIVEKNFAKYRNSLPILADKFEGIDSIEKINGLTSEQLICSRVTDEPAMTIHNTKGGESE